LGDKWDIRERGLGVCREDKVSMAPSPHSIGIAPTIPDSKPVVKMSEDIFRQHRQTISMAWLICIVYGKVALLGKAGPWIGIEACKHGYWYGNRIHRYFRVYNHNGIAFRDSRQSNPAG